MKKMYFLKDRKEAVIDRLTYMSKHRQEYLQDKEHGMITLQFKQGMPVIRFSSGRVTSYWDFSFDGKKMTVHSRYGWGWHGFVRCCYWKYYRSMRWNLVLLLDM